MAPSDAIPSEDPHPAMMGDGSEEQNLNQPGDPSLRITQDEVEQAFAAAPESVEDDEPDEDDDSDEDEDEEAGA